MECKYSLNTESMQIFFKIFKDALAIKIIKSVTACFIVVIQGEINLSSWLIFVKVLFYSFQIVIFGQ